MSSLSQPSTGGSKIQPTLTDIPLEIKHIIAENLVERHQEATLSGHKDKLGAVLDLSLTCKTLRQAVEPVLFKRVTIFPPARILPFLQSLTSAPHVRQYVRVLCFPAGYYNLLQNSDEWITEAAEAISIDPIAKQLLAARSMRLEVLVMMRALQLLPNLQALSACTMVFQVDAWPEANRYIGPSITELELTSYGTFLGPKPRCSGMGGWVHAFQPGKAPATLQALEMDHQCLPLASNADHSETGSEWGSLVSPVSSLTLHVFPFAGLSKALRPCLNLIHLSVERCSLTLEETLAAIAGCPNVAQTLRSLEVSVLDSTTPQSLGAVWTPLPKLTELRSLTMPMPQSTPRTRLSATLLPPKLQTLKVIWTADDDDVSYERQYFAPILTDALNTGKVPVTLNSLIMQWDGDDLGKSPYEDLRNMYHQVELLHEACVGRKVSLVHRYFGDYSGNLQSTQTALRAIAAAIPREAFDWGEEDSEDGDDDDEEEEEEDS